MAQYQYEDTLADLSGNAMHCAHYGEVNFIKGKSGERAVVLDGSSDFIQLPTAIANRDEMTIALWIRWKGSGAGQRIFDFGNNTNQYMYLSTNGGGNKMRFAIKNNGEEQTMDISKLSTYMWKHITITISKDSITAYVDGEQKATTGDITLRPIDFKPIFNYIGRSQHKSGNMIKADIDDLRIYNYAMSADEVAALFVDTDIEEVTADVAIVNVSYYTIDGKCYDTPQKGMNIIRTQYSDGSATVEKRWVR